MNYNELFSQVVSRSKASAIRELLKVIARPDIISFAGGLPAPELFPTHEIDGIMHQVLTKPPNRLCSTAPPKGKWLCVRNW